MPSNHQHQNYGLKETETCVGILRTGIYREWSDYWSGVAGMQADLWKCIGSIWQQCASNIRIMCVKLPADVPNYIKEGIIV